MSKAKPTPPASSRPGARKWPAEPKKPRVGTRAAQDAKRATAKDRFLYAYAEHATVLAAARVVNIGRRTHYRWLESDAEYAKRFEEAEASATDALEGEARRRAIGVEEPVFGSLGYKKGSGVVGHIRKYSDTLLIFLLKAKRPEQFRDRYEVTGKDGAPMTFTLQLDTHERPDA